MRMERKGPGWGRPKLGPDRRHKKGATPAETGAVRSSRRGLGRTWSDVKPYWDSRTLKRWTPVRNWDHYPGVWKSMRPTTSSKSKSPLISFTKKNKLSLVHMYL